MAMINAICLFMDGDRMMSSIIVTLITIKLYDHCRMAIIDSDLRVAWTEKAVMNSLN